MLAFTTFVARSSASAPAAEGAASWARLWLLEAATVELQARCAAQVFMVAHLHRLRLANAKRSRHRRRHHIWRAG